MLKRLTYKIRVTIVQQSVVQQLNTHRKLMVIGTSVRILCILSH